MYLCICKAVTEGEVQRAIRAGARSLRELRSSLGISSECGRCAGCARRCLRETQDARAAAGGHNHLSNLKLSLSEAV